MNTLDDDVVLQSVEEERVEGMENENLHASIHRKPLPSVPQLSNPIPQRSSIPLRGYPHDQPKSDERIDAIQKNTDASRSAQVHRSELGRTSSGGILRKPLGPRRLEDSSARHSITGYNGHYKGSAGFEGPTNDGTTTVLCRERNSMLDKQSLDSTYQSLLQSQQERSPMRNSTTVAAGIHPFYHSSITLIRRDPTSGAQWNIGTICMNDNATEPALRSISINLSTPGYLKFNGQQELPQAIDRMDPEAIKKAIADADKFSISSNSINQDIFERQVE